MYGTKYHNKKIIINGEKFDSKKEYKRWIELKARQDNGEISSLERQKRYTIIPSQRDESGKVVERPATYVADFVYYDKSGCKTVIEDTKGYKTKDYILKRKMMRYIGLPITEI